MAPAAEADVPLSKTEWRERLHAKRRTLSADEIETSRAGVRAAVFARLDAAVKLGRPYRRVFAYEAMPTEPGSLQLLEGLADRGASVYVPLTRPDDDLDWIRWPESTTLGVEAITSASLLLVPALAVDRSGMRLGRGRGCYDRALSRIAPDVPAVALLHRGELFERLPADPWDCRVSAAVTPDGWYDLTQ